MSSLRSISETGKELHGDLVPVLDETGQDVHPGGFEPALGLPDQPLPQPPPAHVFAHGQPVDPALSAVMRGQNGAGDAALGFGDQKNDVGLEELGFDTLARVSPRRP